MALSLSILPYCPLVGSWSSTTVLPRSARAALSILDWVDLPVPSMPSMTMNSPESLRFISDLNVDLEVRGCRRQGKFHGT